MNKFAFIFPGQGSQKVGMGKEIYENSKIAKEILEHASDILSIDFKNLMFIENEKLNISEFTQPAILVHEIMWLEFLKSEFDISPIFSCGHSLGEFGALYSAGALDLQNVIKLVNIRGKIMQESANGTSMMVVLGLSDEVLEEFCKEKNDIFVANYNCDGQVVLAGVKDTLLKSSDELKNIGAKRAMLLNMSTSSHSPLMNEGAIKFYDELLKFDIRENFNNVISNVTTEFYNTKNEALKLLKEQLTSPVRYKQGIKKHEDTVDAFIEFGGSVLKGLNKKITQKQTFSIENLNDIKNFKDSI